MPLPGPSRWFLTAALAHLGIAGGLVMLGPWDGVLGSRWDALVWLLLVGFVGFTTLGFSMHLFPAVARHRLPIGLIERAVFPIGEAGVGLGLAALAAVPTGSGPSWPFALGALLYAACAASVLAVFVRVLLGPRLPTIAAGARPGDSVTVPLFLTSWTAAPASAVLFLAAGFSPGPGFGWWIAGVHLFVLGHVVPLIVAVSLRLVPRSLDADPPSPWPGFLAGLAIVGAISVPFGMLASDPGAPSRLVWFAIPEAGAAVGLVATLILLGARARVRRPQLALHLIGVLLFLAGGGAGLWMVSRTAYGWVEAHALVNVLGFVGLTILIMWFGMIAPFQRLSHAWSTRMLWTMSVAWLGAVAALALAGVPTLTLPNGSTEAAGALMVAVAVSWSVGSLPVLYPALNPLPGLTEDRLRDRRWRFGRP